jgi:hypothetical protein
VKSPHRILASAAGRHGRIRPPARRSPVALSAALLAVAALAGPPAQAALGQGVASVETDRIQVKASVRQVSHAAYTVHELSTPFQGLVREYVSPSGRVFAVTWHGPAMPDLRQMLGANFNVLAASHHRQSGGRGHLSINEGNVVFESNGRMRSFHGRAYLTDALPTGVSSNDIE